MNDSIIGTIPKFGGTETRLAIDAAERAQKGWAKKTAKERSGILRKWFTLMMENQEDLAQIMTAEQGKPLAESRGEIAYGASFIEFFAEEARAAIAHRQQRLARYRAFEVEAEEIGVALAEEGIDLDVVVDDFARPRQAAMKRDDGIEQAIDGLALGDEIDTEVA